MSVGLTISATQKPWASIITYKRLTSEKRPVFSQGPVDHALSGISDWSNDSQRADDFTLSDGPTTITRIRWWGSYGANPDPAVDNFVFQFFERDPANPGCPPVWPLGDGVRYPGSSFSRSVTSIVCNPSGAHDGGMVYEYLAVLDRPIALQTNKHYWLAITNSTPNTPIPYCRTPSGGGSGVLPDHSGIG